MSNKTVVVRSGLDLTGLLFLIFLVLKLTKVIDWSWWYVTMPLWLGWAIILGIALFVFLIFVIGEALDHFLKK